MTTLAIIAAAVIAAWLSANVLAVLLLVFNSRRGRRAGR